MSFRPLLDAERKVLIGLGKSIPSVAGWEKKCIDILFQSLLDAAKTFGPGFLFSCSTPKIGRHTFLYVHCSILVHGRLD